MTSSEKRAAIICAVVVSAIAGYWWFSPHWVIYSLQQAAIKGDTDGVNDRIDYPALRESIRGQVSASMAGKMSELKDNPFAALGGMMAMAMVNQLVDAMVRPEVMARVIATGQVAQVPAAGANPAPQEPAHSGTRFQLERKGVDRVIARPKDMAGEVDPNNPHLVFERRGFADWKMTEIRMPALN